MTHQEALEKGFVGFYAKQMRPPGYRRDAWSKDSRQLPRLFRVVDFRSGLNLLKLRKRAQSGSFGLTCAAAGNSEECENRSGKCGKNADHGS